MTTPPTARRTATSCAATSSSTSRRADTECGERGRGKGERVRFDGARPEFLSSHGRRAYIPYPFPFAPSPYLSPLPFPLFPLTAAGACATSFGRRSSNV